MPIKIINKKDIPIKNKAWKNKDTVEYVEVMAKVTHGLKPHEVIEVDLSETGLRIASFADGFRKAFKRLNINLIVQASNVSKKIWISAP